MENENQKIVNLTEHRKNTKFVDIAELSQEAYSTEERLQVQEIVDEKTKKHAEMMEDIIANHKDIPWGYYICVISKNDYKNPNVIRTRYIVRDTKPMPDWSQDLYYYDNNNDALYFIYSLPKMEDVYYFRKNADLFKPEWIEPYMKAIDAMYDGTIIAWDAPCAKKSESTLILDAEVGIPKLILPN